MAITISPTDLFLLIATVSLIVLMFFLVPLLIQLKKTAQQAENLIEDIDQDIPGILSSAKTMAAGMEKLSDEITEKVNDTDEIFQNIKQTINTLLLSGKLVRSNLVPTIIEIIGIITGIKAFLHIIQGSKSTETKETEEDE